jgi:hypothetical protein
MGAGVGYECEYALFAFAIAFAEFEFDMAGECELCSSSAELWLCLLFLLCEIQAFSDSGLSTLERCLTAFGMF